MPSLAATELADREQGRPSAVRCRLLEVQLRPRGPERRAALAAVAAEAAELGMAGVTRAAREDLPTWLT